MVTRKPLPASADESLAPASSAPYPVTPTASNAPQPFQLQYLHDELRPPPSEEDSSSVWSGEGLGTIAKQDTEMKPDIPYSLRVGPPAIKGSQEMMRPKSSNTNPYLQKNNAQGTPMNDGRESSASAWDEFAERPAPPQETPPPPPVPKDNPSFTAQFSKLSISEPSNNPWQPALTAASSGKTSPLPSLHRQDSGNDVWSAPPPVRQAPTIPDQQPILIDVDEPESPAWDEDEPEPFTVPELPGTPLEPPHILEEPNAWDEGQAQFQQDTTSQLLMPEDPIQQGEGWNMVDHEASDQHSGVISADGAVLERYTSDEPAPALPPRASLDQPPQQPPRPNIDATNRSTSSITSPATIAARTQKKETYEIKKITWHDVAASKNPRVSPILVQNLNGPCPLLALAGDAAQELPDVSDLYQFLLALHTGMNVNPRFFPTTSSTSAADPRNSMSHVHPAEREAATPGTFEDTREMKLYSTFSVPLIHGWLPEQNSLAYAALKRSAVSYEDAQNLMFREEELEDKLQREGLSFEEQATLEDIATIKAFFITAATQLTPFGLETITMSLAPGAVAILFRNDHFSTLYRHPDTLQLLQLVTDMGYAGHEEVVWESLIDVNGENAEFFSGDFRLVGGAPSSPAAPDTHPQSNDGWTTVPIRDQDQHHQRASSSLSHPPEEPPRSPNTEQEDHDLALALQLQEEEEERHHAEIARRQRETELSQQYIEQQGQQEQNNNVPVSQRGGGRGGRGGRGRQPSNSTSIRGGTNLEVRPAIPPRQSGPNAGGQPIDPEAGVDAPPPSYEQAANQAAYMPPANHPAHPNAPPNTQRRMSAYSATSAAIGNSPVGVGRANRRGTVEQIPGGRPMGRVATGGSTRGQGLNQQQQEERSKDCAVM
ncbi:Deubiquitinating enzyme MIY1 [Hyphodiscus hymeniophilus]|uniref:Deubiquitinating enzyme MIY1 n=1 Tax=Hyphodiscus hymeniophilus TaxID=353542 RepID=A0A9P6VHE5_9HELO|nr:Deubiquitinating enzyme MIY1 [Hyphodiscus hymeniophilus]